MSHRALEDQVFRAFAETWGFRSTGPAACLPIGGVFEGVAVTIAKVERGQPRSPWPATQFLATPNVAIPGGIVAYKPNFVWRLGGERKIADSLGTSGLIGFVHHDPVGDPELDRKLVIYADDVRLARALLTTPAVKGAILAALAAAGHIRIHESRVALEISERRRGVLSPLSSVAEVESLTRAAAAVARALETAAAWARQVGGAH